MSAIIDVRQNRDSDGLRRYSTRIKVLVHSHSFRDPIDLSDDVVNASVSKTIKGTGSANINVVARNNYANMIFPNDYVNIYFDIGDGNGWTRTFFGLVDRIEEEYRVSPEGTPTTMYYMVCSDFTKVFDKTNIYFNPHLFDRADVRGEDFNAVNIGGIALQTRGILVAGTPADCVLNQILVQIGFGSQWILPDSYQAWVPERFSNQRSQYAQGRLFEQIQRLIQPEQASRLRAILDGQGINAYERDVEGGLRSQLRAEAGDDLSSESNESRVNTALRVAGLDRSELLPEELQRLTTAGDRDAMAAALSNPRMRQQLFGQGRLRGERELRFAQGQLDQYATAETASVTEGRTIVDIMNLFDFVERRAIDGYTFDLPVWERQGPLRNILTSMSNEAINELFFDLRPMTLPPEGNEDPKVHMSAGTNWDRKGDEIRGNLRDDSNYVDGIRYMPSVIMREYPYSTVHEVDGRNVPLRLRNANNEPGNLGIIYFGGVFSNVPNAPGRHLVKSPILNPEERVQGVQPSEKTYKHLDVAVISEKEIRGSRLGRSDADHFNFFEMFTDSVLRSAERYFMYDFLPIITPIHVLRHGLRVRKVSTRFSRFPPNTANRTRPQATSPDNQESEEEANDTSSDFSRELVPPVAAAPGLSFTNTGGSKYGYRTRPLPERLARQCVDERRTESQRATSLDSASKKNVWRFHAGIDIAGNGPASQGVANSVEQQGNTVGPSPVVAIADGLVVGVFTQGMLDYYGNYVVIYHPQFQAPESADEAGPIGRAVFSCYAHMAHIEPRLLALIGNASQDQPYLAANRQYLSIGRAEFRPLPVSKGEVIGSIGRTAGRKRNRGSRTKLFDRGRAHLHFEINFKVPPKDASAPPVPFLTYGNPITQAIPGAGPGGGTLPAGVTAPVTGDRPSNQNPNGTDPVQWFADNGGGDLVAAIRELAGAESGEGPSDEEDAVDTEEDDTSPSRVDQGQTEPDVVDQARVGPPQRFTGTVDTIDSRQQLGRWSLLQDHWSQHNVEYLSGQFTIRPAPEIRVGYRLDVLERSMSFYVEGVQHSWNFPNELTTNVQVTRGQPNNPYPAYALPPLQGFNMPANARRRNSRLARYFIVPDPIAVRRAIALRSSRPANTVTHEGARGALGDNFVDDPQFFEDYEYAEVDNGARGLIGASSVDFGGTEDEIWGEVQEALESIPEWADAASFGNAPLEETDGLSSTDASQSADANTGASQLDFSDIDNPFPPNLD